MKIKHLTGIFLCFSLAFFSCHNDIPIEKELAEQEESEMLNLLKVSSDGISTWELNNICPVLNAAIPLTAGEIEFLYGVREDEKLTRDLHQAFAAIYPSAKQFTNLAGAEQNHIDAIERIFDFYEIDFPALSAPGTFADENRQKHYDELLANAKTLAGAFTSIATLEEKNIVSYEAAFAEISNPNLELLITNLLKSSKNHFRMVIQRLTALGETYSALFIDDDTYYEIISSEFEQGNKCRQQNRNGGKGGRNGK